MLAEGPRDHVFVLTLRNDPCMAHQVGLHDRVNDVNAYSAQP